MKVKFTRRIYTFDTPDGVREIYMDNAVGGTDLTTLVEETVVGQARREFGNDITLTETRDIVKELDIEPPASQTAKPEKSAKFKKGDRR